MSLAPLSSLAKVAAVTGAGAFLGALQLAHAPATWQEARPILVSALSAAVAAEIVFLRSQLSAYLAGQLTAPPPATDSTRPPKESP